MIRDISYNIVTMALAVSRESVLAAAMRLIAGGGSPTMNEIAAASDVSVRTLYRMFGSREALLGELDHEPSPTTRARILESALELVGRHGLAELSMDELAAAAGVSRATLYRLFPGKPALFRELIQTFSPWEAVADAIEGAPDPEPDVVMPAVGRALSDAMAGRAGLLLRIVFEMAKGDPDTTEGVARSMGRGLPDLIRYLGEQMAAGRLRRMHPVVALQLLAGPIVAHQLTRPLARLIGFDMSQEEVADQIVRAWLRAMGPEGTR
jgi:AcrR family transcriptional regulator